MPFSLWIFGLGHGLLYVISKKTLFRVHCITLYLIAAISNKYISALMVFTSRHTDHLCF